MATDIRTLKERYRTDKAGQTDYGKILTGSEALSQQAYNIWRDTFGAEPTQADVDRALPQFGGGTAQGAAYINSLYNSPDNIYKRQQEKYQEGAPDQYGNVDEQFNQLLGRGASQEERDHFGKLLASGQVDPFQLQEFLKQQPEYMERQDKGFREGLAGELQGQDQRYFSEQIMPGIQSQFAKQGRTVDSSGFQNALAREATGQNREREQFLANLSAQQYGGRQAGARSDYESYVNQLRGRQEAQLTQPYQRQRELEDYGIQQSSYENYLRRYGKRQGNSGLGSLIGGGLGAGLGAYFGGPAGAQAGFSAGSSLGSAGESMWG